MQGKTHWMFEVSHVNAVPTHTLLAGQDMAETAPLVVRNVLMNHDLSAERTSLWSSSHLAIL